MPKIFISYRRDDSAAISGRIYDRLVSKFGKKVIFMDVESIPYGVDFRKFLENAVQECAVELVIIGEKWLDITDEHGKRRLDDPEDFVRIEVETALKRNIPVIPLLVSGAPMPSVDRLPSGLAELTYRNGAVVRHNPDFHRDMDRLIAKIESYLTGNYKEMPAGVGRAPRNLGKYLPFLLAVMGICIFLALALRGRLLSTPTETPLPVTTAPSALPTLTLTITPNLATRAAATVAMRKMATANAIASFTHTPTSTPTITPTLTCTPNEELTLAAAVAAIETASVPALTTTNTATFTVEPVPTSTFTAPLTSTPTPTPTLTFTATPMPTNTLTATGAYTPSSTHTPSLTKTLTFTRTPIGTSLPSLSVTGTCANGSTATFVITNNGGSMTSSAGYKVTNAASAVLAQGTVRLSAGRSRTVTVSNAVGDVTLTIADYSVSVTTTCSGTPMSANMLTPTYTNIPQPALAAQGVCSVDGVATFTVTNSGSAMSADEGYIVKDANGNTAKSGTIKLDNGATTTIQVAGVYSKLMLSIPSRSVIVDTICIELSKTPTSTFTLTLTPPVPPGSKRIDKYSVAQVYVPAGCFMMGSDPAKDPQARSDEQPQHQVCLTQGYWIDAYEVTNAAYQRFIDAGGYTTRDYWSDAGWSWKSSRTTSEDCGTKFNDPQQPRVCVTWYEAEAYAKWRGGHLPTEAEWEYAARGPSSLIYPWGNAWDSSKLNAEYNLGKTAPIGSCESGKSWVGAYDLAGNVWEWVADWYGDFYYQQQVKDDPPGQGSGQYRILRGGSWDDSQDNARAAYRLLGYPGLQSDNDGFRVVVGVHPPS